MSDDANASNASIEGQPASGMKMLGVHVNGCRADTEGISAKKMLVNTYVENNAGKADGDYLNVMCQLHQKKCIAIDTGKLFKILKYKKGSLRPEDASKEQGQAGFYLASALSGLEPGAMAAMVAAYVGTNPKLDQVAMVQFANSKGFMTYKKEDVANATTWQPPDDDEDVSGWSEVWGKGDPIPEGKPAYATIRDERGVRSKIAFLGSTTDDVTSPALATPSAIIVRQWKTAPPNICIYLEAGSIHPTRCDELNKMVHLPQFHEWVKERDPTGKLAATAPGAPSRVPASPTMSGKAMRPPPEKPMTPPGPLQALVGADTEKKEEPVASQQQSEVVEVVEYAPSPTNEGLGAGTNVDIEAPEDPSPPPSPPAVLPHDASSVEADAMKMLQSLPAVNTDELLGDASINNIIFTKLKGVFSALVDAATLANSYIIVDRTAGSGSATAELLLEIVLQRGGPRPAIIAIDSLERLGNARNKSNAHRQLRQLRDLYLNEKYTTQDPNGSEPDFFFDYRYRVEDFEEPNGLNGAFDVDDAQLPFDVLSEHMVDQSCDPKRKWRYFYMDNLFRSATHIVIKNNDIDEFNIEEMGSTGFLYAQGDSRTCKRLRAHISEGKPTVMLHNSGGVVTAFSWLQRVMANMRPPPDSAELAPPLSFFVANLSDSDWTGSFGTPEILMMRSLAERAPMLFRNNVMSVDILTQGEEEVLQAITGCFAQPGGVPELGLGNAEVNMIYDAWMLHLTMCENARSFQRQSTYLQAFIWLLSMAATTVAVTTTSYGAGVLSRLPDPPPADATLRTVHLLTEEQYVEFQEQLNLIVILLPIVLALMVTIMSRMKWRDKWSVCIMAADTLASEIYKFRLSTCEYDMNVSPGKDEDGNDLPPLSQKEKSRRSRQLFVDRVQAFHEACYTELSAQSALTLTKTQRGKKVPASGKMVARSFKEEKPTLAQWWKLKLHVEEHYHRASWAFPQGISFLTWISQLRPFVSSDTMREEMIAVLQKLRDERRIKIKGINPLTQRESNLVRRTLAANLGLPPSLFNGVSDDIRLLQRTSVLAMNKEGDKDSGPQPTGVESPGAMRDLCMEMMGLGKPKAEDGAALAKIKRRKKKELNDRQLAKLVDDDYLAGPLTIDSYMCYRVRPLMAMLERRAQKLAWRLAVIEVLGFITQSAGAVLAVFKYTEWVAVTVAVAATLSGLLEFTNLRDQVTSINISLRDMQSTNLFWDSMSVVKRRTNAVKSQICSTTESSFIRVVEAHTTASSNTISSVAEQIKVQAAENEAWQTTKDAESN